MSHAPIALNPNLSFQPSEQPSPSLAKLFFAPTSFFQSLDTRPAWVKAFLIASALMMLTIVVSLPLITHISAQQLSQLPAERQQEMMSTMRASQYVAILFSPVVQLLKLVIGAYVLWGMAMVAGADLNYRKMLSLLSYVSIIPVLDRLAGFSLNYLVGINNIENSSQIRSTFLSATAFLDLSSHPALRTLADSFDLFSFWYLALLVIGIAVIGRFSKARALFIVSGFFLAQLAFAVGTSFFFVKST